MKNVVFWYVGRCCSFVNRAHAGSPLEDFSTLNMEAILSSEMSVNARSTQRHIPEDDILQSSRDLRGKIRTTFSLLYQINKVLEICG
jgi:hypothetical protein